MIDKNIFEDFDYVVEIKEGQKVCFGSTVIRNTSPIGNGLSPFQKKLTQELFSKTGPGCYATEKYTSALYKQLFKIRSKAGVSPLASKALRFKDKVTMRTPSPGRYDLNIDWANVKHSKAPFGVSSKVRDMEINNNPGPVTYDIRKTNRCRRTRFMYNFGKPTMIHAVETVCVTNPEDTCYKCNTLCEGDYWHKNYSVFLCQICWYEEKTNRETCSEKELKEFKKIRNCSFMHNHEKTNAAIRTLTHNRIKKKIRLENYLDLYIKC